MDVTMFQMDFGESIMLNEGNGACLLVDCGSKSDIARCKTLFQHAENEVMQYSHKEAMISHFHDDHYKGFRNFNHVFDCVYIPHIFTVNQHPNMVDYLLMRDYLRKRTHGSGIKHITLLQLLEDIMRIGNRFKLLQRGDEFYFGENRAEVLWPCPKSINQDPQLAEAFEILPKELRDLIYQVSDTICAIVVKYADAPLGEYGAYPMLADIRTRLNILMQYNTPLGENDAKKILDKIHWDFPKTINDHKYCLVFQIASAHDSHNYLFTGDIKIECLREIVQNEDGLQPIWTKFYAVKAPHHGTPGYYCSELFQSDTIKIEKVFISHGKGYGNYGKIASDYIDDSIRKLYSLICTNTVPAECPNPSKCPSKNCGIFLKPSPLSYLI